MNPRFSLVAFRSSTRLSLKENSSQAVTLAPRWLSASRAQYKLIWEVAVNAHQTRPSKKPASSRSSTSFQPLYLRSTNPRASRIFWYPFNSILHPATFNRKHHLFTMSVVSLLGVNVLNNPAKFGDPYEFEITFECLEPLQKGMQLSQCR